METRTSKVELTDIKPEIKFTKGGWFSRRTGLEKKLIVFSVLAFIAIVALAVVVGVLSVPDEQKDEQKEVADDVCLTEGCAVAAASLIASIDRSVQPCDNFYEFACGKWVEKHVIPEAESSIRTFGVLRDQVAIILKNILEDEQEEELESVKKAKDLYRSCNNNSLIEDRNLTMMNDFYARVGHWPVLDSPWTPTGFSLEEQLTKVVRFNNYPFISFYAGTDVRNSTRRILYLDQTGFGMPGRQYLVKGKDDVMVQAYETLATKIAVELGANENTAKQDMSDIVDFEIHLANITTPAEDRRDNDALYNKMTIRELSQNFTGFDWMQYIQGVLALPGIDLHVTEDEEIIVRDPAYFYKLFPFLSATNPRIVANYILWRIVKNRAANLPSRFAELLQDYNKVIYGTQSADARWKTCVSYATSNLGLAIGRKFVESEFDSTSKANVLEMIENLRTSMKELVTELDWMDETTKPVAKEKADAMDPRIGFPDNPNILDNDVVDKLYVNLTYDPLLYFENVLVNLQESARSYFRHLREEVDKTLWTTAPSTVNAFYNSVLNAIMFPAGILQPPFYGKDQPMSMNYGAIGVVIGHEITHGFDDRGRQYDKDGNLKQWWSDDVIENFKDRAQCIIDQYSNFVAPEANLNLNGINTQGENIADNGGVKQSYRAYRNWIKQRGKEEPKLPGLEFTNDQLFFLNFAQVWCNNARAENLISAILTGVHSPGRFRVIGPLQNSKDFSEVFHCAANTYMNPADKCNVW